MDKETRAKIEVVLGKDNKMDMTLDGNVNDLANMAASVLAQILVDCAENWDEVKKNMPGVTYGLMATVKDRWDEKTKEAYKKAGSEADQNAMQEA